MNLKKQIFILLTAILVLGGILQGAITFTPPNPKTGQAVTFTLTPAYMYPVPAAQLTWDFGDGVQVIRPTSELSITHSYALAGTYAVIAH